MNLKFSTLKISIMSPSSRRAWIEIFISKQRYICVATVALLTEGVD